MAARGRKSLSLIQSFALRLVEKYHRQQSRHVLHVCTKKQKIAIPLLPQEAKLLKRYWENPALIVLEDTNTGELIMLPQAMDRELWSQITQHWFFGTTLPFQTSEK